MSDLSVRHSQKSVSEPSAKLVAKPRKGNGDGESAFVKHEVNDKGDDINCGVKPKKISRGETITLKKLLFESPQSKEREGVASTNPASSSAAVVEAKKKEAMPQKKPAMAYKAMPKKMPKKMLVGKAKAVPKKKLAGKAKAMPKMPKEKLVGKAKAIPKKEPDDKPLSIIPAAFRVQEKKRLKMVKKIKEEEEESAEEEVSKCYLCKMVCQKNEMNMKRWTPQFTTFTCNRCEAGTESED
jgi:hypothetical protein